MASLERAIASAMRAERSRRHWRQRDVAERLGVGQALISAWEVGSRQIPIDMLPRICEVLGVPLAELVRNAEPHDREMLGM